MILWIKFKADRRIYLSELWAYRTKSRIKKADFQVQLLIWQGLFKFNKSESSESRFLPFSPFLRFTDEALPIIGFRKKFPYDVIIMSHCLTNLQLSSHWTSVSSDIFLYFTVICILRISFWCVWYVILKKGEVKKRKTRTNNSARRDQFQTPKGQPGIHINSVDWRYQMKTFIQYIIYCICQNENIT